MELTEEQNAIMLRDVSPMVKSAELLVIKSSEASISAQFILKEIKKRGDEIYAKFHAPTEAAHKAWKLAKELENTFIQPFNRASEIVREKIASFAIVEENRLNELARLAEAKRQEAERLAKEKLEAQAKLAEESGKVEKAEALREKAETVFVAPTFVPAAPTKIDGVSFRTTWKGEVLSLETLVKSIAEGRAPISLIQVNQSALDAFARGVKNSMSVPGVRFYEANSMAVRT